MMTVPKTIKPNKRNPVKRRVITDSEFSEILELKNHEKRPPDTFERIIVTAEMNDEECKSLLVKVEF